jgi:uncharacterized UPF0160 family protein
MVDRSVAVHDGSFHADEVCACALLVAFQLVDRDKIVRSRDPAVLQNCEYVCDVGGVYDPARKLFDHHQVTYQGSLSSAGMVLAYLREKQLVTQKEYHFFNESLIRGVDDHDNGRAPLTPGVCSFSQVISNFSPIEHEADNSVETAAFFQAVDFATGHMKRLHERFLYIAKSKQIVEETMRKFKDCLIFDSSLPWQDNFFDLDGEHHPAMFVIMPSGKHWKLRGIPPNSHDRMKVRCPLPLEWAGIMQADLQKISGIPGAIFCHKGRFISVWETFEDAIRALKEVLKKAGRKTYEGTPV